MVGALSRGLLVLVWIVMMPPAARGAVLGLLDLHREDVDQSRYPWSAIGKVTNETGGSCSGVMIARDQVLTAAHCLYNYRGRKFIGAEAIHFLLGYRTGGYTAHARVLRYQIGAGFEPERYEQTYDADWALLTLAEVLPASVEPLRLSTEPIPTGTKAMLAGYAQDRAQALTADRNCELRERIDHGRLMLHTCRSAHGVSGAPILVRNGAGEVTIAGIQIATLRGTDTLRMVAIPAQAVAQRPGLRVEAHAVLPGDPDQAACSRSEHVATLSTIVPQDPLQAAENVRRDLGSHEPTMSTSVAWIMEDRFLFATP